MSSRSLFIPAFILVCFGIASALLWPLSLWFGQWKAVGVIESKADGLETWRQGAQDDMAKFKEH